MSDSLQRESAREWEERTNGVLCVRGAGAWCVVRTKYMTVRGCVLRLCEVMVSRDCFGGLASQVSEGATSNEQQPKRKGDRSTFESKSTFGKRYL